MRTLLGIIIIILVIVLVVEFLNLGQVIKYSNNIKKENRILKNSLAGLTYAKEQVYRNPHEKFTIPGLKKTKYAVSSRDAPALAYIRNKANVADGDVAVYADTDKRHAINSIISRAVDYAAISKNLYDEYNNTLSFPERDLIKIVGEILVASENADQSNPIYILRRAR